MVSLSELDHLAVDVTVAAPEEYIDGSAPSLLPEGVYDFTIAEWDLSRDRESNQPDGKAIVLTAEVADGEHAGKTIRNIRIWTTVFERNGVKVSGLGDFLRAIDDSYRWTTMAEAGALLQKAQDQKLKFRAKAVWAAFDSDFYMDSGGDQMVRKSPEQKELRKRSTIKGMSHFKQAPDGTYLPEAEGPSGNTIEARVELDRFYASSRVRR